MKVYHWLAIGLITLMFISSTIGWLFVDGGAATTTINSFGETIELYGKGLYRYDSYFRAPIFRGTDMAFTLLLLPLSSMILLKDIRRSGIRSKVLLLSAFGLMAYQAVSMAFGVTYNRLFPLYILNVAFSFTGMLMLVYELDLKSLTYPIRDGFHRKGLYIFLIMAGLFLTIAWLPEVVQAFMTGQPPELIEVYTTEITYVLDLGIIVPAIIVCGITLKQGQAVGYVLFSMMTYLSSMIGVIVLMQTIFQLSAGIVLPLPVLVVKSGVFILLAFFGLHYCLLLFRYTEEPLT